MAVAALVVFTDQRQSPWLTWLRPGFRHCFAVVRDPAGEWLACDWLLGRLAFRVYGPQDPDDLVGAFVARGHTVVAVTAPAERDRRRSALRILTCVEIAKQAIGIGGLRPLTPYGLYRTLREAGHRIYENR